MRLAEFRLFLNTRYSELNLRRVELGKHEIDGLIYTLANYFYARIECVGALRNYAHRSFAAERTR